MAIPPIARVQDDGVLPQAVDVAVIGGGIAGVSAAYFLAKAGRSVAVIEKGVIAGEQSSRNWGWCRVQNRDEREIPLMQRSLEIWANLAAETGGDYGFHRDGLVYVTRSEADMAHWQGWVDMARKYQVHSRMLSAAEARAATPGNDGAWIGGVASPRDGMAEPFKAVPALAEAARRLGVTIHQRCAVRGLDITAGRVTGVITERGRIRAESVLLAGGAWSSMFLRRHGVDLPQTSVRSTVFLTQPAPEVTAGGISTPDIIISRRGNGGYIVAAKNRGRIEVTPAGIRHARKFWPTLVSRWNSVSFGIGTSFFRGPDAWAGNWSFDRPTIFEREDMRTLDPAPSKGVEEPGLEQLAKSWPTLAGTKAAATWGGWIDSTPDAVPVIAPLEALPGLTLSTGYSGHGFGIGPGAGRLAADLILGTTPIVDPTPFRLERLVDGSPIQKPGMI
ncbi:NAD(P)/FAD-dependent oxidoreductase [Roseomonas xinghualingensis]|uniref:NAD(P)/FAD-dependent oxidoreductase n=1 Tax=Roseomonas xinghualingensis TaxID=2986475 RepID=UPI0021F11D73|nr:FAD-binding oxidoreductase [Roseomonas sp. SXEYE001]MCV4206195.1 FAD-binding oxidoreductase [Roseomonas sp. SXEYE001]